MELDQLLFKKVFDFFKNRNGKEEEINAATLQEISSRLTLLARALTGENIDILPAEKEGGCKSDVFYLPNRISFFPTIEQNLNFYIFRIVYLSIQWENKLNWAESKLVPSLEESREKAKGIAPVILQKMEQEYPPIAEFYHFIKETFSDEQPHSYWLYGKFMTQRDVFEEQSQNGSSNENVQQKKTVKPTTEIKAKPVEEVEVIAVDKKAQEDYVLTHNFEKVETAEEFNGLWRGFDGDDTLQEDEDALNELNLKHLVRTDEVAHSIYQAEFRDLANIAQSATTEENEISLLYKEWDYSRKKYKADFCKVFLKKIVGGDANYAKKCLAENANVLTALRRKFAQIHQKRKIVKRLQDGESIDLDSLVNWYAELKSGRTPSDNIYLSKRKKEADLAILFLLDLSLSTDSYADGNRVLDIEKQAVLLFGEVLTEYNVDFAVSGFCSKTRNNCIYQTIKGFGENWETAKQKLGELEPQGYTRIGPALRHSKTMIEQHGARQKWVILLSDGKPNDYDKYEGKYGVADVRQALREMHECHINTYAIAIESVARYYLPQMFGQNHYNILSHPDMLMSGSNVG